MTETATAPETHYFEALKQGRLELQFCSQTGRPVFYPRVLSPYSGEVLSEWRPVSGLGTVYSTTAIRQKPDRGGDYNVALVDLDEGARMMSEVRGLPAHEVAIGLRVKAEIVTDAEGAPRVVFQPVEGKDA